MKRILDRMGKAATTQSTSVQPFAGGILNKYKTGAGRNKFERAAMSHVIKSEPNITQQTLHIQVVAPKAAVPNVNSKQKALPRPERKVERTILRERVTVERETIVFRDVTHIIKEQRTVREIAIAQSVSREELNDGAMQKPSRMKQLGQTVESIKHTNLIKHDHSKRTIPQASLMPTQPLKAEQQADYYKWLQAKLHPGIVIQSIRRIEDLRKPLVKDRVQLKSDLMQAKGKESSKRNAPLQYTNARRAVISQEQRSMQGEKTNKEIAQTIRDMNVIKQEQEEAKKQSAAARKANSEAEKKAKAVKQELREADKESAAARKANSEAEKKAKAMKQEQHEADKQSAAARKLHSEAEKRAEAVKREQREVTSHTFRSQSNKQSNKQDEDTLPQKKRAKGKKKPELEHLVNQNNISEQTETSQLATTHSEKVNRESNMTAKKTNVSKTLIVPSVEFATRQSNIKVTANTVTENNRDRLLVLQRKPQILDVLNERSSHSTIVAKRLIHRTNRSLSEQPLVGDNESTVNLNNNSTIKSVVPSHRKEIKAAPIVKSSSAGSRKRIETSLNRDASFMDSVHADSKNFVSRHAPMVLRRFEQRQSAQHPETEFRPEAGKEAKASTLNRPAVLFKQRNKAASEYYADGIIPTQSRRAIMHKRPSERASQVLTSDATIRQSASVSGGNQTDATARVGNSSRTAEVKQSDIVAATIDLKPITVRGQLIARAGSEKRPLLRNGVLLSHKLGKTSVKPDEGTNDLNQNGLQGKRKTATSSSTFPTAKARATGESAASLAGRKVHRFAAEWILSQTTKSSLYGVDKNKQAPALLTRKSAEQASPSTQQRDAVESIPVGASLVQREAQMKNLAVNESRVKSLDHVTSAASQSAPKRLGSKAVSSAEAKASVSLRAYPTLSVQRKLETSERQQQHTGALQQGENSQNVASTNPVRSQSLVSSFLHSGSRAGMKQLQTVQRRSGNTNRAAKVLVKNQTASVYKGLTTVVHAGLEPNPSVQAGSTAGEQVKLSYTATGRNRNGAGTNVQSTSEASATSYGKQESMPALSYHKPSSTAVQEPPRQVKVDAPRELDPEKLQKMIMKIPQLRPEAIADQVYKALERKMKLEQRRRGF